MPTYMIVEQISVHNIKTENEYILHTEKRNELLNDHELVFSRNIFFL